MNKDLYLTTIGPKTDTQVDKTALGSQTLHRLTKGLSVVQQGLVQLTRLFTWMVQFPAQFTRVRNAHRRCLHAGQINLTNAVSRC